MEEELLKANWRTNGAPDFCSCMLCHHYLDDVFFIMPRCEVCSNFYVPCSFNYAKAFAKDNFNIDIPEVINTKIVLGKGDKKLATKLSNYFEFSVYKYPSQYRTTQSGYEKFIQFSRSFDNADS